MTSEPATEILVLCTGNVCRSPMAEALLRHHLTERGVIGGGGSRSSTVSIRSAGLLASGQRASDEVIELMGARGLDLTGHQSCMVEPEMIRTADLILGMTREHVREAALLVPECFGRTFTLKELVRRGELVGPRQVGMTLAAWLEQVGEGRSPNRLLGQSDEDDIPDPMGRRFKFYKQVARDIDELSARLVALLFP
ncbi:MAG: hypothetical protein N2037_13515 [Acidimicrobiales bacterium]|nr:hypothetical protein [Acidimicrobiales bacterium]